MAAKQTLGISLEARPFAVPKARVSFPLYHSLAGRLVWAPLRYDNGLLAYGSEEHLQTFLGNLTRAPHKEAQVLEVVLYSFKPRAELPRRRYFNALQVSSSLEGLVDELFRTRGAIRETHEKFRHAELQRRVSVLLLDLGPQELAELSQPKLRQKFEKLLDRAADERLYFFLLAQYGAQVPRDLLPLFEWQAWLGGTNIAEARLIYEGLPEDPYNIGRRRVGLLKLIHDDKTIGVHNLVYEPSDLKTKTREVAELEEDAFKEFLGGLG